MRLALIALVTMVFAAESFAQRAPQRPGNNRPGPSRPAPGPSHRPAPAPSRPDYRPAPAPHRPGPVVVRPAPGPGRVVVTPRTTYRTGRVYRTTRRPPIVWTVPFGYSCSAFGDLTLNGRFIHNFRYSMDCHQAISDIRIYGDFCDNDVMFDQTGYMEAQFYSNYECREALGWYY